MSLDYYDSNCGTWEGAGGLEKIEGRITTDSYIQTIQDHLVGTMEDLNVHASDIVFQYDHDLQRTGKTAAK